MYRVVKALLFFVQTSAKEPIELQDSRITKVLLYLLICSYDTIAIAIPVNRDRDGYNAF